MLADTFDFLTRRHRQPVITAGDVFRRACAGDAVETARVLSVYVDTAGIDHVRFRVHIERAGTMFVDEERILSRISFGERYRERVAV